MNQLKTLICQILSFPVVSSVILLKIKMVHGLLTLQERSKGITVNVGVKDKSYTNLAGNEGSSGTDKKVTVKIDSIIPDGNTAIISGTTEPGK